MLKGSLSPKGQASGAELLGKDEEIIHGEGGESTAMKTLHRVGTGGRKAERQGEKLGGFE